MTVNLSSLGGAGQQFFDDNGNPLSGGKLYSYAAGTTTPLTTYTNFNGGVPHTNPIILNAAGRVSTGEIWVTAGSNYKFVLTSSTDVLIATWDNITGINGTGLATDAASVSYTASGTGAVTTSAQAKFADLVMRTDFDTEANYLGAAASLSTGGFWMDESPQPRHWRFADRVFIGAAASETNGDKFPGTPPTGTFLTTQMGAFWMERGATTLSVSARGEFGGVFAARTSDKSKSGYYGTATIGILGIVDNDDVSGNQTIGWAGYFEANRSANNKVVYGQEISIKNKGSNVTPTPYARNGWGAVGIWMPAGGDGSYNGVNANPCSAAIIIGRGDDQGNPALPMTWNRGIIFNADGITGTDGVTGTGIAIELATRHVIRWATSTGQNSANIYSTVDDTTKAQSIIFANDQTQFVTGGTGFTAIISKNTGVDNQIRLISDAAGSPPIVQAGGKDTNIDLLLSPKGTGNVRFGFFTSNADAPVTGYVVIKDAAGNARKLAVIA